MAIIEVDNPRRGKSGEEKFDIIVSVGRKSALGDQMVTILQEAHDKLRIITNPFTEIPAEESVTRIALVILEELSLIMSRHPRIGAPREYALTKKGVAFIQNNSLVDE